MNVHLSRRFAPLAALVLLIATTSVGCATLPTDGGLFGGKDQQPYTGPTVAMAIQAAGRKPKVKTLPLEPGMTIQTALEKTNLTRRFQNMEIKVLRVTPQSNGQPVPLQVQYDPVKNAVDILHDMALHPDDKIIVTEDTSNPLDKTLARFTSAMGLRR